ncbi:MAG: IS1096 element passenger TnpR family protein, partial [Streptosporangiaceae bacterium]
MSWAPAWSTSPNGGRTAAVSFPRTRAATGTWSAQAARPEPPLWRRLDVASDLFLDQVHAIIAVAFGWTGSHLHEFRSGQLTGIPGPSTTSARSRWENMTPGS